MDSVEDAKRRAKVLIDACGSVPTVITSRGMVQEGIIHLNGRRDVYLFLLKEEKIDGMFIKIEPIEVHIEE